MRSDPYRPEWSMTVVLLVVNAVIFLLQSIVDRYYPRFPLNDYFALSKAGLQHGFVWQLLTFQFMHGSLLHLLFNSLAIYVFGRAVEETFGKEKFLGLYFSSGIFGGLLQMLGAWLWEEHFGGGAVVGASAGAFGLVAAFAALFPERTLTLLLAFIIPINMRAKYLLLFSALLALYGIAFPGDHIAHGAHLGGLIVGYAWVRWGSNLQQLFTRPRAIPPRHQPRELAQVKFFKEKPWQQPKEDLADLPPTEFITREVDPILDKISAHGIQSLTPHERQVLEAARAKMAKR